ncbi:dephospho-CoA kinase [Desulfoscipio gibsoniae]|uniref:Dephospho-CoA kinase n=1 Tax=Desulfoscipio gibsoniae DSM 7213 TaxID=767817 RepID=R4KD53_9FIRM|nr:dephospho-CoA kinase [Desulfoscipio gibsoniae]AGL01108.1 dephospho-CoA kinase [Desulfoscipio gibsoniae DSM 7213]
MLIVGLTGNIGSGKSSVARLLKEMGARVIDTDQVAREVVAPGTPGLQQIIDHFGTGVLNADGALDRPKMAQIVFNDTNALKRLNSIVHPAIRAQLLKAIADYRDNPDAPLMVIEAPLLIETQLFKLVDQVWMVTVDAKTQIQRVIKRDAVTAEQVSSRLAAQMPQEDKLPYAQRVIDNSGTPEATLQQVRQIWSDAIDRSQAQAE